MSNKLKTMWQLTRDHGPKWIGTRLAYELQLKSGFQTWRFQQRPWANNEFALWAAAGIPNDPEGYAAYRKQNCPHFFFQSSSQPLFRNALQKTLSQTDQQSLIDEADQISQGCFRYFSTLNNNIGYPPDWHYNPFSNQHTSDSAHWSQIPMFSAHTGDLKFIWEPGRFSAAFILGRAYWLCGNPLYAETFWQIFESWVKDNPPNHGAHWKCGQETSLRIMAWCFAFYTFATSPATTPERISKFVGVIAAQADRVAGDHLYAQLQRNNHAISEGMGLWTVGILFPELKKAQKWRDAGRKILEEEAKRQIYDDGAYVQHSTNYHRLMLHDFIWAIQLGKNNGYTLSAELNNRVQQAGQFLFQLEDQASGRVPNYGANDGALILPLNCCDYRDFRPVLGAVHYLFEGTRLFDDGPWNEDLIWLFGPESLDKNIASIEKRSLKAQSGGYYTLRGDKAWGMIRCATYQDRPAQADMLHLDIWRSGENLACDSGTYFYYAEPPWDNGLVSTLVHNTVSVDKANQMSRGPRFLWLDWLQSSVAYHQASNNCRLEYFQGEHYGYNRLAEPITHRRAVVRCDEDIWIIIDDLIGAGSHDFRLHWQLADLPFEVDIAHRRVMLTTHKDKYGISLNVALPHTTDKIGFNVVRGTNDTVPRGWQSSYYGGRQPAISVELSLTATAPCRMITVFAPEKCHQLLSIDPEQIRVIGHNFELSGKLLPPNQATIFQSILLDQASKHEALILK